MSCLDSYDSWTYTIALYNLPTPPFGNFSSAVDEVCSEELGDDLMLVEFSYCFIFSFEPGTHSLDHLFCYIYVDIAATKLKHGPSILEQQT